jgi:uncharacterized membrane protein
VTLYDFLKFVHVLAAITWVGGNITGQFLARRAIASGDPVRMAGIATDADWIGRLVYVPAAIVLVIAGVWMVLERDLGFGRGWVMAGIGGFTFSLVLGAVFNGPEAARIGKAIEEKGGGDPEVVRRINRVLFSGRIELLVLLTVVFFMTTKVWD